MEQAQTEQLITSCEGGVTAARGFVASGIHAGFRANPNKRDLALVVADDVVAAAGVFTQNVFAAAPVRYCQDILTGDGVVGHQASYGCARAIVINSGNANAATGLQGDEKVREEARLVAEALGCVPDEVLVCSTGVIGVQLPLEPLQHNVSTIVNMLSSGVEGAADAASAILTTDTFMKQSAVRFSGDACGYPGAVFTVGGMAKGSGMIMPNMATMIAIITTDAPITPPDLQRALKRAADASFNKVTVDSDTSTNDTCLILASGAAAPQAKPFDPDASAFALFEEALCQVCTDLARDIARDGEGATRLVNVYVRGAATEEDADKAARTVASSPLVKTAIAGHDANWGRIAAALGRSGAKFCQEDVDISIMGIPVCRSGLALVFDEDLALSRFESPEVDIEVDLGAGDAQTCIWTCDLTHDYISINADYRT